MNATVNTNKRSIAADEFFVDVFETALADDELVVSVSFPIPAKAAYQKFPNPASRYAVVGVMVAQTGDGVRVAVTGAGPSVFRAHDYVADRSLATALFLSLSLGRPLFLEGDAGVGKTEIAKVIAAAVGSPLVRLQCYEGLDIAAAAYEWNYPAQMMEIRLAEAGQGAADGLRERLYSEAFLTRRPLLQALQPEGGGQAVLLIDELDRADEPFEAFLLEVLSDFQMSACAAWTCSNRRGWQRRLTGHMP